MKALGAVGPGAHSVAPCADCGRCEEVWSVNGRFFRVGRQSRHGAGSHDAAMMKNAFDETASDEKRFCRKTLAAYSAVSSWRGE
jgi:hypothetical protein